MNEYIKKKLPENGHNFEILYVYVIYFNIILKIHKALFFQD